MLIYFISSFILLTTCEALTTRTFINSNLTMNGSKYATFIKLDRIYIVLIVLNLLFTQAQLTLNTNEATVNFFALGDWGGFGVSTGSLALAKATPSGFASANLMGSMGSSYNTKFQLGLGDNFYCKNDRNQIMYKLCT